MCLYKSHIIWCLSWFCFQMGITTLPLQAGNSHFQSAPCFVAVFGDSRVPSTEFADGCNQLKRLTWDAFWSCSRCLQQAFTQVQNARQASLVKQQLLLHDQLLREMQGCAILRQPGLSPALTALAQEVMKNSVFSVVSVNSCVCVCICTQNNNKNRTYGGSVTLICNERRKMLQQGTLPNLCSCAQR